MPYQVAAFYQFAALPDFRELREPLRAICADLELKGSVLLAHEGINGTIAGEPAAIDALIEELQTGENLSLSEEAAHKRHQGQKGLLLSLCSLVDFV